MSLPEPSDPLVSIVMPVFNGSNFLSQAIDSSLSQTYNNIEIIVVNDGSDDGGATKKVMDSYTNNIRSYHKKNGGVASALNFAIKQMKGDYFSWLSHDDLYHPEKVASQIEAVINSQNDRNTVIYSDYQLVDEDGLNGAEIKIPVIPRHKFRYFLTTKGAINGCTLLIPKKCFDVCGLFDEQLKNVQDYDMWFRIASDFQFIHIPKVTVYSRQHKLQGSRAKSNISQFEGNELLISFVNQLERDEILEEGFNSLSYGYAIMSRRLQRRGYKIAARRATILSLKNFGKGKLKTDLRAIIKLCN